MLRNSDIRDSRQQSARLDPAGLLFFAAHMVAAGVGLPGPREVGRKHSRERGVPARIGIGLSTPILRQH